MGIIVLAVVPGGHFSALRSSFDDRLCQVPLHSSQWWSKQCVRLYEYRGGVTHYTLVALCRLHRNPNEKNQKEKSVSSAICLRHKYCSWPGLGGEAFR